MQMDVTTNSFEERRQARQDCRQKEQEILDEAAALGKDVPQHELAAHLGAAAAQARTRCGSAKRRSATGSRRNRKSRPPCE